MGSIQAQTASLGQTVTQMIPMLFNFLFDIPLVLSFGNTNP
ncbi:hypothetical protein P9990_26605 (plasmid) [Prescottella equi]|nr:hypothetical protein [Prescottella equi]WJJ14384.1 hypothetical protein P9990_26605 [Prescottella equi]